MPVIEAICADHLALRHCARARPSRHQDHAWRHVAPGHGQAAVRQELITASGGRGSRCSRLLPRSGKITGADGGGREKLGTPSEIAADLRSRRAVAAHDPGTIRSDGTGATSASTAADIGRTRSARAPRPRSGRQPKVIHTEIYRLGFASAFQEQGDVRIMNNCRFTHTSARYL
jgi:hypothetical protein